MLRAPPPGQTTSLRSSRWSCAFGALEQIILAWPHVPFGKPASTFPGHALAPRTSWVISAAEHLHFSPTGAASARSDGPRLAAFVLDRIAQDPNPLNFD